VIRLLVRIAVAAAANAIGLIVAAALLDGVHLNGAAFFVAVAIFTVVFALLHPFLLMQMRRRRGLAFVGAAVLATLIALIAADLLSDGLTIEGAGTWIAATVIVWLAALLAAFILPFLGLRKFMEERRD
jgi:putative membrane protein